MINDFITGFLSFFTETYQCFYLFFKNNMECIGRVVACIIFLYTLLIILVYISNKFNLCNDSDYDPFNYF